MPSPPTAADSPTLPLALVISLLIAEERPHGWAILYRGTFASTGTVGDVATLEDAVSAWLLEFLQLGRAPQVAVVKFNLRCCLERSSFRSLSIRESSLVHASGVLRLIWDHESRMCSIFFFFVLFGYRC